MAVTQGMSTLARDGTPRASLLAIVEVALQGWPRTQARAHGKTGINEFG
jgi:hypothetical protein